MNLKNYFYLGLHMNSWRFVRDLQSNLYPKVLQRFSTGHRCFSTSHENVYFSGIQPTGVPHIGNYFGFIKTWIKIQEVRSSLF